MPPEDPVRPFSTWMEQALFAPDTGYYSARIRTVGRRGDFATSATVSNLLGEGIARWISSELERQKGVRAIIEVGGGDGSLSASVRSALGWWQRRKLAWHMVETSPILKARQQERLKGAQVHWHETMESALQVCGGRAIIFHNELVDAFPVTLLEWEATRGIWQEVWVVPDRAGWREELRALTVPPGQRGAFSVLTQWHALNPPPQRRQRVELHRSFRDWMQGWSSHWQQGAMLTVDYGDLFPGLYYRRAQGTLRAYLLHQRLSGPDLYQNMGRQDITADVNFSDLLHWGESLGWRDGQVETQAAFLKTWVPDLEKRLKSSGADQFVAGLEGAGEAFKVWTVRTAS
ncbi:SAM-dependent methyltransferase [Verrucomicrobium sp. BvORR034]|uniref:SAM-dependent methyltransferase n=1 Tax=Verrucomicrobium sp. BvORR034 TaxID=1396418 RepID=UPI000678DFBF|nr:SAM-dependent methyltransferase [Verrucomicrobium sp. BvORR034]